MPFHECWRLDVVATIVLFRLTSDSLLRLLPCHYGDHEHSLRERDDKVTRVQNARKGRSLLYGVSCTKKTATMIKAKAAALVGKKHALEAQEASERALMEIEDAAGFAQRVELRSMVIFATTSLSFPDT